MNQVLGSSMKKFGIEKAQRAWFGISLNYKYYITLFIHNLTGYRLHKHFYKISITK